MNSSLSAAINKAKISGNMLCTKYSAGLCLMKHTQFSVDFYGRHFLLSIAKHNGQALFSLSGDVCRLTLNNLFFSTKARLFKDALLHAAVLTFETIGKMPGNKFHVKNCKCFGVPCKGPLTVHLSRAAAYTTSKERLILSVVSSLPEVPGTEVLFRDSFWYKTWGARIQFCVITLGTGASACCIKTLGASDSSGIIETLKGKFQ
jgi:hypothetical protein